MKKKEEWRNVDDNCLADINEKKVEEFRKKLIKKETSLNWSKKLLKYGTAGTITGGALSAAILGSLVLANVLALSFFTVNPLLPILIIAAGGILAFLATVITTIIKEVNNTDWKMPLKAYKKLETDIDGKSYIETYFKENNSDKPIRKQDQETIKNTINKWNITWKGNEENKKNWTKRYVYELQKNEKALSKSK